MKTICKYEKEINGVYVGADQINVPKLLCILLGITRHFIQTSLSAEKLLALLKQTELNFKVCLSNYADLKRKFLNFINYLLKLLTM